MTAATIATVLEPAERARVEAAGQGCFRVLHGGSLEEAIRHVRRAPVDAVLLSVHRCSEAELPRVAQFVREFPHVPAVALLSRVDESANDRILRLGASGVHEVVDVSVPSGWHRLRALMREPNTPVVARVMAAVDADLHDGARAPQAALDIVSTNTADNIYAQIWRNSSGMAVATMTAGGVIYADASGYPAYQSFDFYAITGDMVNWLAKNNIPAISVLLTNHTNTEWAKNQAGIEALLKYYSTK